MLFFLNHFKMVDTSSVQIDFNMRKTDNRRLYFINQVTDIHNAQNIINITYRKMYSFITCFRWTLLSHKIILFMGFNFVFQLVTPCRVVQLGGSVTRERLIFHLVNERINYSLNTHFPTISQTQCLLWGPQR